MFWSLLGTLLANKWSNFRLFAKKKLFFGTFRFFNFIKIQIKKIFSKKNKNLEKNLKCWQFGTKRTFLRIKKTHVSPQFSKTFDMFLKIIRISNILSIFIFSTKTHCFAFFLQKKTIQNLPILGKVVRFCDFFFRFATKFFITTLVTVTYVTVRGVNSG